MGDEAATAAAADADADVAPPLPPPAPPPRGWRGFDGVRMLYLSVFLGLVLNLSGNALVLLAQHTAYNR